MSTPTASQTPVAPENRPAPGSFDADARAEQRERSPITVGGVTFRPRRKTWHVTRAMRALLRDQGRAQTSSDRLGRKLEEINGDELERLRTELADDELTAKLGQAGVTRRQARLDELEQELEGLDDEQQADLDGRIAELEDKLEALADQADETAYELIALLLAPADEGGAEPSVDLLKNSLDVEEAGDLAARLATGAGEPDPTPTPTTEN